MVHSKINYQFFLVESPVRQGVETKAYQVYVVFSQRCRTGWIGFKNV